MIDFVVQVIWLIRELPGRGAFGCKPHAYPLRFRSVISTSDSPPIE